MAKYKLTLIVDGANIKSVESKLAKHFSEEAVASAKKVEHPRSRAEQLSEASDGVEEALNIVESLTEEMQDWYDNLPESFQSGDKGSAIQECVDALENLHHSLEDCDFESVNFPGMYE